MTRRSGAAHVYANHRPGRACARFIGPSYVKTGLPAFPRQVCEFVMRATAPSNRSIPVPAGLPESAGAGANRRRHERLDYRTAALVVIPGEEGFRCVRCQTDDVSFEGARLICFEAIPAKLVYLRILMPGLSDRFVEAEIVNERQFSELRIGIGRESRYNYGVRFRKIVDDPALIEQLQSIAVRR
jgi:hypothetical protein